MAQPVGQQTFELPRALLERTLVWLLRALAFSEVVLAGQSVQREIPANSLLLPAASGVAYSVESRFWFSDRRKAYMLFVLTC